MRGLLNVALLMRVASSLHVHSLLTTHFKASGTRTSFSAAWRRSSAKQNRHSLFDSVTLKSQTSSRELSIASLSDSASSKIGVVDGGVEPSPPPHVVTEAALLERTRQTLDWPKILEALEHEVKMFYSVGPRSRLLPVVLSLFPPTPTTTTTTTNQPPTHHHQHITTTTPTFITTTTIKRPPRCEALNGLPSWSFCLRAAPAKRPTKRCERLGC